MQKKNYINKKKRTNSTCIYNQTESIATATVSVVMCMASAVSINKTLREC